MSIISRGLRRVQRTRTFTFVGSAISTTSSIDISGIGIQAGDIGVYLDFGAAGSTPSAVTPSGHTLGNSSTNANGRCTLSYKVLAGSETTITGINTTIMAKVYLVFRPSVAVNTVTYVHGGGVVSDTNPASRSVDPSAETTAVIVVGVMAVAIGTISPRTMTPTMDEVANGTNQYGHYKIYNTTPVNHSVYDMDDEGARNSLIIGYLTFT